MFKILSTYIKKNIYIKCNIGSVAVRPSYIWDALFLKVNLNTLYFTTISFKQDILNTLLFR